MDTNPSPAVTVFTGPSLSPAEAARSLPGAEILPPVARGDLYRARERGAQLLVVIDGTFSHSLAVSPREVVDVLRDGAVVLGSSSMGALRAVECGAAGMLGVGTVYRLYRTGLLTGDDEVAVTTDPDRDYAATSVALVNIRLGLRRAAHRGLLTPRQAGELEDAAQSVFFAQRNWRAVFLAAGVADPDGVARAFCEQVDVKRDDARRALRAAAGLLAEGAFKPSGTAHFTTSLRYPGHDPMLGLDRTEAASDLLRWLFGSGRYQRYVWPLAVGEPEFGDVATIDAQDRADALRERLAALLARTLRGPAEITEFAERLALELEFLDEFQTELMRRHAVIRLADEATAHGLRPSPLQLRAVRESVAVAHGYEDWPSLAGDVTPAGEDGTERLYGALPLHWVEEACDRLALARAWQAETRRPAAPQPVPRQPQAVRTASPEAVPRRTADGA
ncbi:TfuA-like protein [Streptomyces sp. NPDC050529]|uniref:TfuA-like protein n=1 Tax=Streptomyces sp. NPDC050529 TaxID=3365624 RepID=UPI00378C8D24